VQGEHPERLKRKTAQKDPDQKKGKYRKSNSGNREGGESNENWINPNGTRGDRKPGWTKKNEKLVIQNVSEKNHVLVNKRGRVHFQGGGRKKKGTFGLKAEWGKKSEVHEKRLTQRSKEVAPNPQKEKEKRGEKKTGQGKNKKTQKKN